jgi:C4-dicarboxylate transporter DctM subunit
MDTLLLGILIIFVSIGLVIVGIPIGYVLLFCAVVFMVLGLGPVSFMKLGVAPFAALYSLSWTPLVLFVLLALIINQTTIATDIFAAANYWLSRLRGGLVVTSIIAEAVMAAAMGGSGICILAVGKVALPEMERLKYNRNFSVGALLAGGVLGPLIPPSIPLVVYGILTQQSIGRLLIAGVIPGIVLAVMLAAYAMIACTRRPDWAPLPESVTWRERFFSIQKVWPIIVIMLGIIGAIYAGVATATEAAGVGCVVALIIAVVSYRFRFRNLIQAMTETATIAGLMGLMLIASIVFTFAVGVSGLARDIADVIIAMGLSPWMVIVMINIAILILGCLMDTLAIFLVTVPIFVPIIMALGFDPLWFGIVMVVNTEIGLITPPIGLNLFLTSGVFGIPVAQLLRGVLPFLAVLLAFLGIVIAFPELSLWLPSMMR